MRTTDEAINYSRCTDSLDIHTTYIKNILKKVISNNYDEIRATEVVCIRHRAGVCFKSTVQTFHCRTGC